MSRKVKARTLAEWFEQNPLKTQADLAESLGVVPSYVSMLVNGERTPSLELALRIEGITGVPVSALVATTQEASSR
jgi:transcriptional regulator with XRE-family HTH domain